MTLADRVSNLPNEPGGRLWSKAHPDPVDLSTTEENLPTLSPTASSSHCLLSHCSHIDSLLIRLSEIEHSVVDLDRKVAAELVSLQHPPQATDSRFPLKHLVAICDSIQDDLSRVQSKAASVVELRRSLSERLEKVHDLLAIANDRWTATQKQSTSQAASEAGMHHNTGKLFSSHVGITLITC